MSPLTLAWLQFAACAAVIGVAGVSLVRHGEAIADLTGLSQNWIGLVLVAGVTSLPELVTGLSAVTIARAPDIAIGDALGSCVFNIALLALVDLLHRKGPVYRHASTGHILTGAFGVLLLCVVAAAILMPAQAAFAIGRVGTPSLVVIALYLVAMRTAYLHERGETRAPGRVDPAALRRALLGYGAAAAAVLAAGVWLPFVAAELAAMMGWSHSLVGTLFVAFATSIPELATTLGALRAGAIDLAFGNLLGSNLFDLAIVALDDFAWLDGPIYRALSPAHAVTAIGAAAMTATLIVALAYRPTSRVLRTMHWTSLLVVALYVVTALLQFAVAAA